MCRISKMSSVALSEAIERINCDKWVLVLIALSYGGDRSQAQGTGHAHSLVAVATRIGIIAAA
jgi:hypothetical protein